MKNLLIQNDLMRYKKNKFAGNLVLLALVFNCLYFMFVYAQTAANGIKDTFNNGKTVYSILTGLSVILNLVLLLVMFLTSEELKGYNKKFSIAAWVIAAIQLIRIAGYPLTTYSTPLSDGKHIFGAGMFILLLVFLVASAGCLIAAGVIGWIRAARLEKFKKDLAEGKVDLDAALAEDETPAAEVEADKTVTTTEVE